MCTATVNPLCDCVCAEYAQRSSVSMVNLHLEEPDELMKNMEDMKPMNILPPCSIANAGKCRFGRVPLVEFHWNSFRISLESAGFENQFKFNWV